MKKIIKITLGTASVIFIGVIGYLEFLKVTFVDRTIKKYTRIDNYVLVKKVHDNHQWYAKMTIRKVDEENLFKLYQFRYGYTTKVLAGKSQTDYIKDCPNCWYYLDDKGHGIYGYVLYCINEDKNQLEVFEEFGN